MQIESYNFDEDYANSIALAHVLARHLIEKNGIVVAAPQINITQRVLALKSNPIIVAFNPILIEASEDLETMEEGSISLPGFVVKIKRPNAIKVRFTEPNGNVRTEFFMGLTARYFQQGLDYINGISFTQRANPTHKQQAINRQKRNG